MDVSTPCEYCKEKQASVTCGVCGAHVCSDHDREHGCAICKGRMEIE